MVGPVGEGLSDDPSAQRREFFPALSLGECTPPLAQAEILSLVPTARTPT